MRTGLERQSRPWRGVPTFSQFVCGGTGEGAMGEQTAKEERLPRKAEMWRTWVTL